MTQLYRHDNQPVFEVTAGGGKLKVTPGHRFWVEGRGWVAVDHLQPGDQLLQPDGGTITVQAVSATGRTATVYNFEVESAHDYYVRSGSNWVLVHNDCIADETIHSIVQGAARDDDSAEVAANAQRVLYNENGNQVWQYAQGDGTSQVMVRNPANGNIVTTRWSSDAWIERQIENGRWFGLDD